MIPILYESNEENFTANGLGPLPDATSCNVIEERNGQYTLTMNYPITGIHYDDIEVSRFILVTPSDGTSMQPFRITKVSKPTNGIVTVNAVHRSYQLTDIPCGPFTAANVSAALQGLKSNALESCPFTFWTDKTTTANYTQLVPASIRQQLGGVAGSILDVYGGEYEFDNLTVKLHAQRGANRGVVLRYGKNITDIRQEKNIENVITGIVPFYYSEGNLITLPEHVVYSENAGLYPYHHTKVVDFSSEFTAAPTVAELRAKATSYVAGLGVPAINIKVSFVALWQTEEYKDIANRERVKLCDTVTVIFDKLGVEATAKVIKTDYDVLHERYNSIELGDSTTNLVSQIVETSKAVKETPSMMRQAIDSATQLITGGLGGHVVFKRNANGEPEEILIMDTDSVDTAVNVIRMNMNGIGFSTTGYSGPFRTAWTINGAFVADFITAGVLRAIDIEGVNITGSRINGSTFKSATSDGHTMIEISNGRIEGKADSSGSTTSLTIGGPELSKWLMTPWNLYGYNIYGNQTISFNVNMQGGMQLNWQNGAQGAGMTAGTVYACDNSGMTRASMYYGSISGRNSSGTQTFILNTDTGNGSVAGSWAVSGTKSRVTDTKNYGDRLFYCYETPTPYFGDLGEGKTDESGKCYIFLDDILDESTEGNYQVFLQAYGDGVLYVSERTASYFVVDGEPNTAFGWELKAPQRGYSLHRLEPFEHEEPIEDNALEETYQYLNQYLYNVEGESA